MFILLFNYVVLGGLLNVFSVYFSITMLFTHYTSSYAGTSIFVDFVDSNLFRVFSDNPEKEQNERSRKSVSDEELSDNDKKHEEDAESEEPKEGEDDSENTQSDHAGGPPDDARELDSKSVSALDGKQLDEDKEGSGRESEEADDMDSQPASCDKPDKNTCNSGSADDEHSDDELLVLHFNNSCKVFTIGVILTKIGVSKCRARGDKEQERNREATNITGGGAL